MKRVDKRGQMEMSFGMIVSIILIIFFVVFAFYGIKIFLGVQDTAKTTKFIGDFRADIDTVWKSTQVSQEFEYFLPSKITHICFVDFNSTERGQMGSIYDDLKTTYFGTENMVFYPIYHSETDSAEVKNIDLDAITEANNPFCIPSNKGKITIRLSKDISDSLVTVSR